MKNHIDITFDLETVATTVNAAVMQVAAVVWLRDAVSDPFDIKHVCDPVFDGHVDLRSCVVEGYDFSPETLKWWSVQSEQAKKAVCEGLAEPIEDVFRGFVQWIKEIKEEFNSDTLSLWCQGMDFDAAILRNTCRRYDIPLDDVVDYRDFRDCRTIICEAGRTRLSAQGVTAVSLSQGGTSSQPSVYDVYEPLPSRYAQYGALHDALYDAALSSWRTWQALHWLNR